MRGSEPRYLGHNPAGAAMIVLLLLSLTGLCATGILYTTDLFWGVEWVEELHEALAHLLLGLVAVHIIGVIFTGRRHQENLPRAMITGYKRPLN
ncbi:hypothetical protein D5085_16160 [Ectothiorhodospiraceae bacterium BW-2]|nr:hypothetical protein D5085_16160 [Ectothiorhodospiraceae bacterium BW-2]